MPRILVATISIPGHVVPMIPVVKELIARGHDILWYCGEAYRAKIEATGAAFAPVKQAIDFSDSDYDKHFPGRSSKQGTGKLIFDLTHVFVKSIEGMYLDLLALKASFDPAILLGDVGMGSVLMLSQATGIPAATLNITALAYPDPDLPPNGLGLMPNTSPVGRLRDAFFRTLTDKVLFRPVQKELDQILLRLKLPPFKFGIVGSEYLTLQPSVPAFEYKRRNPLPPYIHFIGPLLPAAPQQYELPAWWPEMQAAKKPIVLVTQGTIATDSEQLIAPTLAALANKPLSVIATTGGKTAGELGLTVPANAKVEPFIPFAKLMPHISLYITNGGFGGVMYALSNGLPIIAGGTTEDKPEIGSRIAYSGVGINLKTATPSHAQVGQAVDRILADAGFRTRAQQMQAQLGQHNAPSEAADLIEQLINTRKPVLRQA
jgi:UDP:flavonoid glycosyltransferase YjiC (YdhE family)